MATNKKYTVPFDPLWLDLIVELGKEGATPANIAAAINMSETTLKKLIKERKNFAQAFELAMTHSKSFHEKALRDSYTNKDANSALIVALLRSVFPADYQTATQSGNGAGARKKEPEEPIDFNMEIQKLLSELKASDDRQPAGKIVGESEQ